MNEDLAEAIIEHAADAIIYADASGTIARWNDAATKLYGYTAAEALGQSLDLIIPERLRAAHWRGFDAAIASGATRLKGHPTVTRAQPKSGEALYVEMSFALVLDAGGKAQGSVAMARDVTERVQREKAARAASGPAAPAP
jgi:PAS domain S-box-containing protein